MLASQRALTFKRWRQISSRNWKKAIKTHKCCCFSPLALCMAALAFPSVLPSTVFASSLVFVQAFSESIALSVIYDGCRHGALIGSLDEQKTLAILGLDYAWCQIRHRAKQGYFLWCNSLEFPNVKCTHFFALHRLSPKFPEVLNNSGLGSTSVMALNYGFASCSSANPRLSLCLNWQEKATGETRVWISFVTHSCNHSPPLYLNWQAVAGTGARRLSDFAWL